MHDGFDLLKVAAKSMSKYTLKVAKRIYGNELATHVFVDPDGPKRKLARIPFPRDERFEKLERKFI